MLRLFCIFFFFSSRRRHTRYWRDWSSDVCSSDLCSSVCCSKSPGCGGRHDPRTLDRRGDVRPAVAPPTPAGGAGCGGPAPVDRESGVLGKRGDLGGCRIIKKKKKKYSSTTTTMVL